MWSRLKIRIGRGSGACRVNLDHEKWCQSNFCISPASAYPLKMTEVLRAATGQAVSQLEAQFANLPLLATPADLWQQAMTLGQTCRQIGHRVVTLDLRSPPWPCTITPCRTRDRQRRVCRHRLRACVAPQPPEPPDLNPWATAGISRRSPEDSSRRHRNLPARIRTRGTGQPHPYPCRRTGKPWAGSALRKPAKRMDPAKEGNNHLQRAL